MPPDSWCGRFLAKPPRWTVSMSSLARRRRSLLRHAGEAHRQLDVGLHGEPREQRRLLEHERRRAVDVDAAGGRLVEAGDEVEDRRLAAAGGPDEADELAGVDVEVDAGQRGHGALPEPNDLPTPRARRSCGSLDAPDAVRRADVSAMHSEPKTVSMVTRSRPLAHSRSPGLAALGEDLVEQGQVVDAGRRQVHGVEQPGGDGVVGGRLQRRGDRVERELEVLPGAGDRGVGEAARRDLLDAVVDDLLGGRRRRRWPRRWRRRGR